MSIRVMSLVWDGFPGGGSELLAMLAFADWSDDDGKCYPSMDAIARKLRLSRSQAQRVAHRLIELGHVSVVGNDTGGAPGSTRRYLIDLDRLTGRMDATGSAHATGRTDAQEGPHGRVERGRTDATQTVSEPSLTVRRTRKATTRPIPDDFQVSERVRAWAAKKGFDRLDEHLEAFKTKCAAKGYVYADHDAAFMEAVRTDWAELRKPGAGGRTSKPENFASRDYGKGGPM